jgi:WD40 repeat protein
MATCGGVNQDTVNLWDTLIGRAVGGGLSGHTKGVMSATFSPDSTRLASASWDSTIRLWDASTGRPVGEPLTGHTSLVRSVAFSPRLASASYDGTVRLWTSIPASPSVIRSEGTPTAFLAWHSAQMVIGSSRVAATNPCGCGTPKPTSRSATPHRPRESGDQCGVQPRR